jgi:hypothetical protein
MDSEKIIEINEDYAKCVFDNAKRYFCDGIYVKTNDMHPCGWDFISFEYIDEFEDLMYPIGSERISNAIYDSHDYEDLNLLEILQKVGMDGWCFEISGTINW